MSYYSYTILECTNPELISSGSTFVRDSKSKLLKIKDGKSHFLTRKDTMDREIIELSMNHPGETFNVKWHWDEDYCDCIIYLYECKNGEFRKLGIEPGYTFVYLSNITVNKEEQLAFQSHVLEYLNRIDLVIEMEGSFTIDKLNNKKDKKGYESYITITYENDFYKWTATKKWISWIEVTCEKKEPKINPLEEYEKEMEFDLNNDSDELPF